MAFTVAFGPVESFGPLGPQWQSRQSGEKTPGYNLAAGLNTILGKP